MCWSSITRTFVIILSISFLCHLFLDISSNKITIVKNWNVTLTFNLLTLKNMSKDAIREDVGYHDVRLIKGETTAFIVQMI